jgi:hypothetical protein
VSDSEWLPIETAPRDGTVVKLMCESSPTTGVQVMYWSEKNRRWEGMAFTVMRPVRVHWNETGDQPTHWMPLPPDEEQS